MLEQINKAYIKGSSGCKYEFGEVKQVDEFPDMPGIFYFYSEKKEEPIYVERTESLKKRIDELIKDRKDVDFSSHIRFHIREYGVFSSLMVEDLIEHHNPLCQELNSFRQYVSEM